MVDCDMLKCFACNDFIRKNLMEFVSNSGRRRVSENALTYFFGSFVRIPLPCTERKSQSALTCQ